MIIKCSNCQVECESSQDSISVGYGTMDDKAYCYKCCGQMDAEQMKGANSYTLYLVGDRVTNWPNSFSLPARVVEKRHNMSGKAKHVWVKFDNSTWYGKNCSHDSQLINLKRCKGK